MAGSTSDVARWTNGAGTGNLATAGNWAVESGTPSTPPAAGEVALFDSRANGDVTATLDHFNGTTLGEFRVNGYRGDMGGAGGGLDVDATLMSIDAGGGALYIGGTIATLNANSLGGGSFTLTSGTTTTASLQAGDYKVNADAVVTTLNAQNCNLTVEDNATAITTARILGSTASITRAVTTLTEDAASKVYVRGSSNTVGTLNIHGNATHYHQSNGTVTTLNGHSGKFTPAGSPFSAVTVSTLNAYNANFELVERSGGTTVTVSSRADIGVLED